LPLPDFPINSGKIVIGRKHVGSHNMKKFLNLDIFVGSTHVAWKRPVNVSRHVTIAP